MEISKEEPTVVLLDRASRATRGKRMNKLLDDEIEQDEVFWNQDALKEEENDDNYEEEQGVVDEFDSDFDEDEPDLDDEGENDVDESKEKKKRLIFPGKLSKKKAKKKKKKEILSLDEPSQDEKSTQHSPEPEHHDAPEAEGEKVVRKSTRTAVIVRQAERDAIRAALQATLKPIKRKKEGEEKKMTQEEMLLEAAQTEIRNLRNLQRVLAREEEVKKRAIVHKPIYSGPQIRYLSKDGSQYIEFRGGLSFQSLLSTESAQYPEKAVCAVTGLPAKYRDPKTGLPYATKEAFKIIRERFASDGKNVRIQMDMGDLFDSLDGKGFSSKRKRSPILKSNKALRFTYLAPYRKIPTIEIEDDSE